jgi:hypothetical protein
MEKDYSYVSVQLLPEYQADVIKTMLEANVAPEYKHELHCTLMYDERDIEAPLCALLPSLAFTAHITKLEPLGDGLVFHLTSKELNDEFRRLKDAGYQHSYGTPLFHMSLKYDFDKYDIMAINAAFSDWAGRPLVFSNECFGIKKPKKVAV